MHFHPPLSEGGLSPAAAQLNPPPVPLLVVVVIEGVGPNPVKLGLNVGPAGFGVPNENADGVVEVDAVGLDVPNGKSPGSGVGVEETLFEAVIGPEEDEPGLEASQIVHFSLADAGFIKSQVPHFHSSVFDEGGFNPVAPQSNPFEPELVGVVVAVVLAEPKTKGVEGGFDIENDGTAEEFSPPGFGASHTVHFSVADAGFIKAHVPHTQPSVFVGGFNPAAPQSNPPELELVEEVVAVVSVVVELAPNKNGVEKGLDTEKEVARGFEAPDLGASHTIHFSIADAEFIKLQTPHFHPSCFGGFKPAATQSNPALVVGGVVVEFETGKMVGLVLDLALLRLDDLVGVEKKFHPLSMGISSSANPLTSFSALNSPELLPSLTVLLGRVNVSSGRSESAIERTSALASFGEVGAVGETEDAEEVVSSLSALILNRNFEGSLGAEDLRPKKGLPVVVGEIAGVGDKLAPLRPEVCRWGISPGSTTSEGRRNV